jgi:predicted dehydrogenase
LSILKVGILGQGRSGRDIHAKYLVTAGQQYRIAAVCDLLPNRRALAATEFGCDTCADYRELLGRRDLDLIINALPSHLHVPVTQEFLAAGFNVLSEKPLARRAAEVDALIAAAQRSGKLLAIFQQSRYAPYFRQVRQVIASGVLGRIVQISIAFNGFSRRWDWQTLQEFNGGSLLNTGPHPVDQALQLLGTDIMPQVTCIMDRVNTYGDAEDYVKLLLRAPGRPLIDLEISSCCAYPAFMYSIQASRGGLKGTAGRLDWKYWVDAEAPPRQLLRDPLANADGTPAYCSDGLKWHEESWEVPKDQPDAFSTMSGAFYSMLHRTLTTGVPLEITPQQVRQQIAVMEECHRQNPLR